MKKSIIIIALSFWVLNIFAQEGAKYRRSSLYSMLISHPSQTFHKEITDVFFTIPVPDKFDDHSLSVKVVSSDTKRQEDVRTINTFIEKNNIARRMVGKWFDRDPELGYFDMGLIAERGYYDASYFDISMAKMSARGTAQLADAGEELIKNSFLIVNDIKYADKAKRSKLIGTLVSVAGAAAAIGTGMSEISDLANLTSGVLDQIKGFRVTVTSYLYRLDWNDEIASTLYQDYYVDQSNFDIKKKESFDNDKSLFKLTYVGKQSVASGKTSLEGINTETPEQMIRKVCTRAIDESIVELQRAHEEFRVKTPIYSSVGKAVHAKIGMKEGVTSNSKFEVLEQSIDNNGKTQYKRVGVIKPVSGKIWDNRFMAIEEKAMNAGLEGTEFTKVSGDEFVVGMLIREIK